MAAGYLGAPGSNAGPCVQECRHTDCAATRSMAAAACYLCQEAIGYNIGFYNDPEQGLVHRLCYLRSIEKGSQEQRPPTLDEYDRARREQEAQDHGEEKNREKQEESPGAGAAKAGRPADRVE